MGLRCLRPTERYVASPLTRHFARYEGVGCPSMWTTHQYDSARFRPGPVQTTRILHSTNPDFNRPEHYLQTYDQRRQKAPSKRPRCGFRQSCFCFRQQELDSGALAPIHQDVTQQCRRASSPNDLTKREILAGTQIPSLILVAKIELEEVLWGLYCVSKDEGPGRGSAGAPAQILRSVRR